MIWNSAPYTVYTSFISKSCFLCVVSKEIMSKQKFSVEVLHLVWKFDEDRIYNEKIFFDTRFYIWKPIFNFTQSEIGGTSENIKIDRINNIFTKFGPFITICMILPLTTALYHRLIFDYQLTYYLFLCVAILWHEFF